VKNIPVLSGYPEWLPEQRIVEQRILDTIRRKFELSGFTSIETRSVERLDVLLQKGQTNREVYVLRRLHAGEEEENKNLGLVYDLTVPFSRYVGQFRGQLTFPFKRYQMQKVWRGERPQEGRYREFCQADADVVAEGALPLSFDMEMGALLHDVLSSLPIPPVRILINNRKVLDGACRALDVEDVPRVLRNLDKLDKLGEGAVRRMLLDDAGLRESQTGTLLELARIRTPDASFADRVRALGLAHPLLDAGIAELTRVMDSLAATGSVTADLHIARGFDYYTGTVYEGVMTGHEAAGAVCAGGRYDDLIGSGFVTLPGVGISIGVSRILGRLFAQNALTADRRCPTCVLVALAAEAARHDVEAVARALRTRGISTEVHHEPGKYDRQIRYAERKGIPYVWFTDGNQVRDIRSGVQAAADPATWMPPEEDLVPQVRRGR
jgi:histidyl-tRNA synthetase